MTFCEPGPSPAGPPRKSSFLLEEVTAASSGWREINGENSQYRSLACRFMNSTKALYRSVRYPNLSAEADLEGGLVSCNAPT